MKLLLPLITATILLGLSFASCKKDDPIKTKTPSSCNNNPIRFDALEVGQTSCYIGLRGEEYNSGDPDNFVYSNDTLQVAIIAKDGNGYLVEESFYYAGDVFNELQPDKDSVYHYYLEVSNDTLHFKPKSSNFLFSRIFGYQLVQQGLPLDPFANQSIELNGWKTNLPYCECLKTGYTENYMLFEKDYPFLNVLVDNSAMAFDGNGETYVYAAGKGIVRSSNYSWWNSTGIGWDLLAGE